MSNSNNEQVTGKEPFSVKIAPSPFESVSASKQMTSNELCKIAGHVFGKIFKDFEGMRFEVANNFFYLAPVFNHGRYNEDDIVAVTLPENINKSKNDLVNRMRSQDMKVQRGDRYTIAEDGKQFFSNLLTERQFRHGNPQWNQIVVDFTEQQSRGFYGFGTTSAPFTKINFIDPKAVCALIYGAEEIDDNGETNRFEYHIDIMAPLGQQVQGANNNYLLNITRISEKSLREVYEKVGMGSLSSIIRV